MKLAFYYHIPVKVSHSDDLFLPGFLGVFVDALACKVDELFLIAHTENGEGEYKLLCNNITLVNIGNKTPAWHRYLFHNHILCYIRQNIRNVDVLLVRSPTPLAPALSKLQKSTNVIHFIVGDYEKGADLMQVSGFRDQIIKYFLKWHNLRFENSIRNQTIIVNSPDLEDKYRSIASTVHLVKTTTLSSQDFFGRSDTCVDKSIKLLYTGRYDWAKGFKELVEAMALLRKQGDYEIHFVGWEDDERHPVENGVNKLAKKLKVDQWVFFHGKKRVGDELNQMYRMADIYVIPSYHEGFPRTIWEALANSLPVVATKVGAIPAYLNDKKDAVLIQPKSTTSIVDGIKLITSDPDLRQKLIANGIEKAKENSLELQTDVLISILSKDKLKSKQYN